MAATKSESVYPAIQRAYILTDPDIRNDQIKRYKSVSQKIFEDETLSEDDKLKAMIIIAEDNDYFKVLFNKGEKRLCKDCNKKCLATLYCEHCVRIYLIDNFSNWTSGNNKVDSLIQECQMETVRPSNIIEWIPYKKLQNIKYLTSGGFSDIYLANWIDGSYIEWYSEGQRLIRTGPSEVILKKLEKVERSGNKWYEEIVLHLKLRNRNGEFVTCYGLTKDPSDGSYMIVMRKMDADLRNYFRQKKCTWKEKLHIANDIIKALCIIHQEKAIHRDLHSGNVLCSEYNNHWYINDFGLCGPADKSQRWDLYGNLPFIAPEVLRDKELTSAASDIYSFGILMWEISSGREPFYDYEGGINLTVEIRTENLRPKIVPGTPLKYKELMQKCWDADPRERPDAYTVSQAIDEMRIDSYKDDSEFNKTLEQDNSSQISSSSSDSNQTSNYPTTSSISSKIYPSEIPQITDDYDEYSIDKTNDN